MKDFKTFLLAAALAVWAFAPVGAESLSGTASWYGEPFHGRKTASGQVFDMYLLTAAHKTLPFGTRLKVTNLNNQKSVLVTVNDRGPFVAGRILDLSRAAAKEIEMIQTGVAPISIEILGSESRLSTDSSLPAAQGDIYQVAAYRSSDSARRLFAFFAEASLGAYVIKHQEVYRVVAIVKNEAEKKAFLRILQDENIKNPLKKSTLPEGEHFLTSISPKV